MAKRMTIEEFTSRYRDRLDWDNLYVLGEYSGMRNPIAVKCKVCDWEYEFPRAYGAVERPDMFKCRDCHPFTANSKRINTTDSLDRLINDRYDGKFTLLTEFNSSGVHVRCNDCQDERSVKPTTIVNMKMGCKVCSGSKSFTTEEVAKKISEISDGEYSLKGDYVNAQTSIDITHNNSICGNYTWRTMYGNFVRQGRRCPECTYVPSVGESRIREFLINLSVHFEEEYRIDECRHKRALPFDFAVFREGRLDLLIEFDGKQHFSTERGMWGSENDLDDELGSIQLRDGIKNKYCKDNNIRLLRIKYTDIDSIERIIYNTL